MPLICDINTNIYLISDINSTLISTDIRISVNNMLRQMFCQFMKGVDTRREVSWHSSDRLYYDDHIIATTNDTQYIKFANHFVVSNVDSILGSKTRIFVQKTALKMLFGVFETE